MNWFQRMQMVLPVAVIWFVFFRLIHCEIKEDQAKNDQERPVPIILNATLAGLFSMIIAGAVIAAIAIALWTITGDPRWWTGVLDS